MRAFVWGPLTEKQSSDSLPDANAELTAAIGAVVAGRYRITRLIGEGGMGAVYEAEHVEIGKRVAIKLVRAIHARHTEIAARFRREARSASAIESDHIVQVFDAGNDPELGLFMAMELLRGQDLGSVLERTRRLDPETACSVVIQAASALDKAHGAGIVHRDLKPANIFLVERENQNAMVKLVDFGIAKIVRDENTGGGGGLTRTGSAIGTPNYMSPEQAQGLTSLDHRTDIYSLGAVLYEMVVGTPPFAEMPSYEQTILQILTKPVPRAIASSPHIPPALDQLIADMMKADPAERVGTMREVRDRILGFYPGLEKARLLLLAPAAVSGAATPALRVSGRPASGALLGPATSPLRIDGIPPAVPAQTNVAVSYDAGGPSTVLGSLSPAGVPKKARVPVAVIGAALGLVAVVVATLALRSGARPAVSASGAGLVTSIVATSPPPPALPAPSAEPAAMAAPPSPVASATEPLPSAVSPKPPATKSAGPLAGASRPAPKSTPPFKERPGKPGQVGGVGIANEF
jgi:eukaryotic-like serine/threonine-protein kinase